MAIACRPATPAPSTSTLAGRTVPAAVVSIGKKRAAPARRSARRGSRRRWPARRARPSTGRARCAGSPPSRSAVTPASASARKRSAAVSGARKPISTEPRPRRPISSARRRRDLGHDLGPEQPSPSWRRPPRKRRPGWWRARARAGLDDHLDAALPSRSTTSGTSATRRSPLGVSLGTETFMIARPGSGARASYRVGCRPCADAPAELDSPYAFG